MKYHKKSYSNLNELEISCSDKTEIYMNSCFGFIFLLINGYWFSYIYETYIKK